jgi:hypothetical protein
MPTHRGSHAQAADAIGSRSTQGGWGAGVMDTGGWGEFSEIWGLSTVGLHTYTPLWDS